jgi:rare lipoprotein A (peptidoglycan hydrolase)
MAKVFIAVGLIMSLLTAGFTISALSLIGEMADAYSHPKIVVVKGTYQAPLPTKNTWSGTASYYSESGCVGCSPDLTMANGQRFNENALTIAFNKLPLGALVMVTNVSNEQAVTVEVTDRGGFEALGRIADLSLAVKRVINCSDLCEVRIKEI